MLGILSSIFGSGIVGSVERLASEAIETDKETAEAKSLFIKTLDPNGMMRRELSRFACKAYGFYLVITSILALMHAFGVGEAVQSKEAMEAMADLFLPITAAWGTIVGASFGVNATNSIRETKD
jgi:hypothetical protein